MIGVQDAVHAESGVGGGCADQIDDDLVGDQWPAAPVHGDLGEQPVFDLVPFAGSWREVAHGDGQSGLGGEFGEFDFPGPDPVAVGSAAVGADQQPVGVGVAVLADGFPPAAQCRDGERGGVVVDTDRDPAGVGRDVVDAIGDGLAQVLVGEVVDVDAFGLTHGLVLASAVLELPDQFLLLGVDRDHRLPGTDVLCDRGVEVTELGVAVLVLAALGDFGVALQAEAHFAQHPCHRPVRDPVPHRGQRAGQLPGRLGRPHQQRHRITAGGRIDQRPQVGDQLGVGLGQLLAPATGRTHPARRLRLPGCLTDTTRDGVWMHPGRCGDRLDPAPPELAGLQTKDQAALPLVEMRTQHRVLASNRLRYPRHLGHSTTVERSAAKT